MKDQYAGDVNDFLKYGLLRALTAEPLSLGVVWMLTPSDGRSDGQKLAYLAQEGLYRSPDPQPLRCACLDGGRRRSERRCCRKNRIAPHNQLCSGARARDERRARERYFATVWSAISGCDVAFFDPDNGFRVSSVAKGRRYSAKYVYWTRSHRRTPAVTRLWCTNTSPVIGLARTSWRMSPIRPAE